MKNFLLKILFSKAGPYIAATVGSGLAIALTSLAPYGVEMTQDQQEKVAGWVAATIITVGQGLLLAKASNGVKEIQQATRQVQDGVPGEKTIEAVKDAVTSPARKLPLGGPGK